MDGKTAPFETTIELGTVSDVSVLCESGNSCICGVLDCRSQSGVEKVEIDVQKPSVREKVLAETAHTSENPAVKILGNQAEEFESVTADSAKSSLNRSSSITTKSQLIEGSTSLSESSTPQVPVVIITNVTGDTPYSENLGVCENSKGQIIPTVIITSDSDRLTDDDIRDDKSVLNRLRYYSVGSGASTELYATAYSYKSDYDSSCEDTEALYTAADWTEDSSADIRLDSNIPTVIDIDSSDCENSFGDSEPHIKTTDSLSSISFQGFNDQLDSVVPAILIDGDLSEGDAVQCMSRTGVSEYHNSCQSQGISLTVESSSDQLSSAEGISERPSEICERSREEDVSDDINETYNEVPVNSKVQRQLQNQIVKANSECTANDSGIPHRIDDLAGTPAPKIELSDESPPNSPTCSNLSVEQGNLEPSGNPSNSSYRPHPLESPSGTEHCHGISRADVHSDSHVLDENVLTLHQSAESRNTGNVSSTSKLHILCNGRNGKISNNIKDEVAMRRRREDEGEDDEAQEELMGAGDRRGSDMSIGSHFEIRGDEWNIALLLWLYLLQGIPLGLTAAIPMIIQNRGVSFKQQAEFSFATWPFSLKLLWAPLVDAVYYPSFGRRKTWLVPAQYLIGFFMVFLSFHINDWLSTDDPQVGLLTLLFFVMNFLAATQDIAVDGWALTMLKRQNRGLASMCNSVGQNAGFFLGYVVFIALESPEFCNKYLRSEPAQDGLVTLPGFLYFWGTVYLVMTTLVAFIKREVTVARESPSVRAAFGSYHLLLRILKLPNIQLFAFLLLTSKMGFAAFDGVTSLKFIEKGVPKDKLALVAVPLVPLQILLPILITKMNHPRRPMDLFLKAYPYRLAFNFVGALFVYITPIIIHGNADVPYYFYIILIAILAIHQGATSAMFVQMMAFFALVSDADAGGTYMTLLNTLANLGGTWTTTSALAAVDSFTWRSCLGGNLTTTNDCANSSLQSICKEAGGTCVTELDGYYVEILVLTVVGIVWFWYGRRKIDYLQSRPLSTWAVPRR